MTGTSSLVLCLVLGLGVSLVSATSGAQGLDVKPTMAPLRMSSAKPTVAPKILKSPPTRAMIINIPPKLVPKKVSVVNASEISGVLPTVAPPVMNLPSEFEKKAYINKESNMSAPANNSEMTEAVPMGIQPMGVLELATSFAPEKKESTREMDSSAKVAQVTGFITGNGNIYEITDSNGLGKIEMGRQSSNECKFGGLFIYSDIPCDKMTNIKMEDILENLGQQKPHKKNKIGKMKSQRKNQQTQHQRLQQKLVQEWYDDLDDDLKKELRIRQQHQSKGNKGRIVKSSGEMLRPLNNKNNRNNVRPKPLKTQLQWNNQQKLRYQKLQSINNQNRLWNKSQKRENLNQSRHFVKKNCLGAECNGVSRRVNSWVRKVQKFL